MAANAAKRVPEGGKRGDTRVLFASTVGVSGAKVQTIFVLPNVFEVFFEKSF